MTLQTAFDELAMHSRILRETLIGLHMNVIEDKPLHDDVVLVDMFGDSADNLLGWLEEIIFSANAGEQADFDLENARRALVVCQERYNSVMHGYTSDLAHFERLTELSRLGRKRGGEWRAWAESVKASVEQCQQPLFDMNQALFQCWREMTARV